jgi:hypothetical protein
MDRFLADVRKRLEPAVPEAAGQLALAGETWLLALLPAGSEGILQRLEPEVRLAEVRLRTQEPPAVGERRVDVAAVERLVGGAGRREADEARREQAAAKHARKVIGEAETAEPSGDFPAKVQHLMERLPGSLTSFALRKVFAGLPEKDVVDDIQAVENELLGLFIKSGGAGDWPYREGKLRKLSDEENTLRTRLLLIRGALNRRYATLQKPLKKAKAAEHVKAHRKALATKQQSLRELCPHPLVRPKQLYCREEDCAADTDADTDPVLINQRSPATQEVRAAAREVLTEETAKAAQQVLATLLEMFKADTETAATIKASRDQRAAAAVRELTALGTQKAPFPDQSPTFPVGAGVRREIDWDYASNFKLTHFVGPCPTLRERVGRVLRLYKAREDRAKEDRKKRVELWNTTALGEPPPPLESALENEVYSLQRKALQLQWDAVLALRIRGIGTTERCAGGDGAGVILSMVKAYFDECPKLKSLLSPGLRFAVDFLDERQLRGSDADVQDIGDTVAGCPQLNFRRFMHNMDVSGTVEELAGEFTNDKTAAGLIALTRTRPEGKTTPWLQELCKRLTLIVLKGMCFDLMCKAPVLVEEQHREGEDKVELRESSDARKYLRDYHPDKKEGKRKAAQEFIDKHKKEIGEIVNCFRRRLLCPRTGPLGLSTKLLREGVAVEPERSPLYGRNPQEQGRLLRIEDARPGWDEEPRRVRLVSAGRDEEPRRVRLVSAGRAARDRAVTAGHREPRERREQRERKGPGRKHYRISRKQPVKPRRDTPRPGTTRKRPVPGRRGEEERDDREGRRRGIHRDDREGRRRGTDRRRSSSHGKGRRRRGTDRRRSSSHGKGRRRRGTDRRRYSSHGKGRRR